MAIYSSVNIRPVCEDKEKDFQLRRLTDKVSTDRNRDTQNQNQATVRMCRLTCRSLHLTLWRVE
ncbi:Putative methyltransferase DDB_G0268948 [Araneus ventricosus]|uniref:Methyltransferase DDB_G0268948 n=1 Tax=Araneus ventricosus TaxID=182803 RepID=A0A4Y2KCH3_ARAVE|nr:Putative methyltransferase DDB_G0268948 [Araneus ventricosus]